MDKSFVKSGNTVERFDLIIMNDKTNHVFNHFIL